KELGGSDVDAIVRRFTNKRARDFNPASLKEYGRRVRRALDLYERWRSDPANFSVKTRATNAAGKRQRNARADAAPEPANASPVPAHVPSAPPSAGGYTTSLPIRADWVLTVTNIPSDLTVAEAERLAKFVRMLAVE